MADLIPGENFVNGQQVDDTRLNNHVAGARLTAEAISSRDLVPTKAMENGDLFLVKDASDAALRSAKLEDVRQSNLPLAASTLSTTGTATIGGNTTVAGTLATTGNISTSAGNITSAGSITATNGLSGASLTTSGNASVGGALTITGNTTFTGTVTGISQIKEILEYTIFETSYQSSYDSSGWCISFQSVPMTKPASEIWVIEVEAHFRPFGWSSGGGDTGSAAVSGNYDLGVKLFQGNTLLKGIQPTFYGGSYGGGYLSFSYVLNVGTVVDNTYFKLTHTMVQLFAVSNAYYYVEWGQYQNYPLTNKFRITKYKTN